MMRDLIIRLLTIIGKIGLRIFNELFDICVALIATSCSYIDIAHKLHANKC